MTLFKRVGKKKGPRLNTPTKFSTFDSLSLKFDHDIIPLNSLIDRLPAIYYLTPNTPLIQLWCARSKLNMDEICSLNIHL